MKILAEFNGERVYIVNIREEKGLCDCVKTKINEKGESVGELILVDRSKLLIIDSELLLDNLKSSCIKTPFVQHDAKAFNQVAEIYRKKVENKM